jgi:excisionase family DNA binding protein
MVTLEDRPVRRPRLSGTDDVAYFLGCSSAQVREYVRQGRLRAIVVGRSLRYSPEAIDAFVAEAARK